MAKEAVDGYEDLGESQEFGPWYNAKTGQPFARLPMDPRAFQRYARRGWMPGIAPKELQIKWEAGQAGRDAANMADAAKYVRSATGKELQKGLEDIQPTGPSTEDVADAVIDKLLKRGMIKVQDETIDEEIEASPEGDTQLKLL